MGRPVILSNNTLAVGLNEHGLVHDFYFPYVGQDNLTNARNAHHRIGIWVDGVFSWVHDGSWEIIVDFDDAALVSKVLMRKDELGVEINLRDFVDSEYNVFCRQMTVHNKSDKEREIRVFFHQVFQISKAGRGDTAFFVPDDNYILDYRGTCSLIIYAKSEDGKCFDQYAVGNYGIEGKEGTFRDAEDGELSGNAVEHGGVDSVVRISNKFKPNQQIVIDYWIVASDNQFTAEKIHDVIVKDTLVYRMEKTIEHWSNWLEIGSPCLAKIDPKYRKMTTKSLMMVKAHTDKNGGIIASLDSSIYNYGRDYYSYVWPRDGAYAMWPLIRMGYKDEPRAFFRFCRDVISDDGYMMHKYQPDKSIGSTWHPLIHNKRKELAIQEDETALVIYMLNEYLTQSQDYEFGNQMYDCLIKPAADFMTSYIDEKTKLPHASYDLWEEKFLTSTYTVAVTYQSLIAASVMAEKYEHSEDANHWKHVAEIILENSGALYDNDRGILRKGFLLQDDGTLYYDNTLDASSLYGAMMFGLHDKDGTQLHSTVQNIEKILFNSTPSGGMPRYEHDNYFLDRKEYLGNPWLVTTLWMAQYYMRTNNKDKAAETIDWVIARSLHSGALTEQIDPLDGSPLSVDPLVWSHAELINTILDLSI